jgi:hypothetical protein
MNSLGIFFEGRTGFEIDVRLLESNGSGKLPKSKCLQWSTWFFKKKKVNRNTKSSLKTKDTFSHMHFS